jgi:hypothetical protein
VLSVSCAHTLPLANYQLYGIHLCQSVFCLSSTHFRSALLWPITIIGGCDTHSGSGELTGIPRFVDFRWVRFSGATQQKLVAVSHAFPSW